MACNTTNTWEQDVIPMIRVLIGDMLSPYTYSDDDLRKISLTAANMVFAELSFTYTYTVDFTTSSISPDPKPLSDGKWVMSFIALKSACLITSTESRQASKRAVKWTDGPSSLDTQGGSKDLADLSKRMCDDYVKAKMDWAMGPGSSGGQAVYTPTTNSNVFPYFHPNRYNNP